MKKKIKDLSENEIKQICESFDGKCEKMYCHQDMISVCPLKMTFRCLLKTKVWKRLNEEIEL